MTSPPPEATALMQGVQQAAAGTPYVVTPTAEGFGAETGIPGRDP